jgi:DNA recombination protein RmuC
MKNILSPLQDKIQLFEKSRRYPQRKYRLSRSFAPTNFRLTRNEYSNEQGNQILPKALKGDSKMQGNWGELCLSVFLKKSGLEKGREYEVQQSFTTEDGNRVFQIVINLPDGKKMIVDSKVSLTAYENTSMKKMTM